MTTRQRPTHLRVKRLEICSAFFRIFCSPFRTAECTKSRGCRDVIRTQKCLRSVKRQALRIRLYRWDEMRWTLFNLSRTWDVFTTCALGFGDLEALELTKEAPGVFGYVPSDIGAVALVGP